MSDLPNVDFPTITVTARCPGASPETMAATVATPLEKQFSTIAGIDNMTSTSSLGQTQIVDPVHARPRTSTRRRRTCRRRSRRRCATLPQGIIPPSYQKTNPADAPILTLALTSDVVPLSTLDEYGETTIAQRLSMVGGVAQVLRLRHAEVRRAHAARPGAARRPAASRSRTWPTAVSART